jgi:4-hydroxy-tetrahydrodipicolinate synthase
MTAETTLELANIDNVVAMKEASGDFDQIMEIARRRPEGFGLLSGDDAITLPMISTGADGVISVVGQAFPQKFTAMVNDARKGDFNSARINHFDLLPVTKMFFAEGNPGGVKVSLAKQGIMQPFMRRPLYPVSDSLKSAIEKETERLLS